MVDVSDYQNKVVQTPQNVKDIVEHNFDVIMNRQHYGVTKNVEQLFNK